MANTKQTQGECACCGTRTTRGGMSRHLRACAGRAEAIRKADAEPGPDTTLLHLVVRDAWAGHYWLHLEMDGAATLQTLDQYLRAIWLECCGHMSRFSAERYGTPDLPMSRRAERVLAEGASLMHVYDFGDSSETQVSVAGARKGKRTTPHPIALMARNVAPPAPCMECERQAAWICMECQAEHEASGLLCEAHVQGHPHEEYGDPLALVNSPRTGMCAYDGPSEPPY
ncbi:MAG: hypothetical protein JWM27_3604 [Gemmatimonadetes bacterium]|nr:hypothetical protein [Gemmatimonadota bacterium]